MGSFQVCRPPPGGESRGGCAVKLMRDLTASPLGKCRDEYACPLVRWDSATILGDTFPCSDGLGRDPLEAGTLRRQHHQPSPRISRFRLPFDSPSPRSAGVSGLSAGFKLMGALVSLQSIPRVLQIPHRACPRLAQNPGGSSFAFRSDRWAAKYVSCVEASLPSEILRILTGHPSITPLSRGS